MASDLDKQHFSEKVEHHEAIIPADPEKTPIIEGDDDGKVTLKTKLAVLSLILMYESYLFTLVM
jgi:hypothetical protein